jgi:hypothetical protein
VQLLSIILAYIALAAGVVAAFTMLYRLGRGGGGKAGPALLVIHRAAGYLFLIIMTFLFAGMLAKITTYGDAFSPRVAWHAAAGFAVAALMLFKWAVVRPFRGLLKLAPALGMTALALAAVVVGLGPLAQNLAGAEKEGPVEIIEVVPGDVMRERHAEMMEMMRPAAGEADAVHAARFVFAEKCGKCHHLRRAFEEPYDEAGWPPIIERMRGYDPAWIKDDDAAAIELYLNKDYGPGS